MPCYRPLRAWKDREDRVALCGGLPGSRFGLPCGRCVGCLSTWSSMWATRCYHESLMHDESVFVTLTYDDEHLPERGSLRMRDWQLFAKRVRKNVGPFRYFYAGEYGEQGKRPHYHALMFGIGFWSDARPLRSRGKVRLYTSSTLEGLWKLGHVSLGQVTPETCWYAVKYAAKKHGRERVEERVDGETGEVFRVVPEFVRMSRRPGIGATWFDRFSGDVFPSDELVVSGRRCRVPRFYDDRGDPEVVSLVKEKRREAAGKASVDNEPRRLEEREQVAVSRLAQLGR